MKNYRPQLDGLRCFGMLAVMLAHYVPARAWPVVSGEFAVQMFLVLSGFLITGSLLRARAEDGDSSVERAGAWHAVRRFHVRHAIRLLPLYYLFLAAMFPVLLAMGRAQASDLAWHGTFTSNFLVIQRGGWTGSLGTMWSLSVQQQFYLLWPFLVLFLPRRALLPAMVALICAAPAMRAGFLLHDRFSLAERVFPGCNLDTLVFGGLLAYWRWSGDLRFQRVLRPAAAVAVVAFAGLQILLWHNDRAVGRVVRVGDNILLALMFGGLVDGAYDGLRGVWGRVLEWRPVLYLGRISYGVYIVHQLPPRLVRPRMEFLLGGPYDLSPAMFHTLVGLVSAILALAAGAIGWHFIEQPAARFLRGRLLAEGPRAALVAGENAA